VEQEREKEREKEGEKEGEREKEGESSELEQHAHLSDSKQTPPSKF